MLGKLLYTHSLKESRHKGRAIGKGVAGGGACRSGTQNCCFCCCEMHIQYFAACLTFRDFYQIFNATQTRTDSCSYLLLCVCSTYSHQQRERARVSVCICHKQHATLY